MGNDDNKLQGYYEDTELLISKPASSQSGRNVSIRMALHCGNHTSAYNPKIGKTGKDLFLSPTEG